MDGQSHARPDRDMPFATQPLTQLMIIVIV
jgi:hypothetical protein